MMNKNKKSVTVQAPNKSTDQLIMMRHELSIYIHSTDKRM